MQTPTSAEIRTAIQVLKRFGEHINHNPEANYQAAENKVFEINPNSTVIRSDVQDAT